MYAQIDTHTDKNTAVLLYPLRNMLCGVNKMWLYIHVQRNYKSWAFAIQFNTRMKSEVEKYVKLFVLVHFLYEFRYKLDLKYCH